MTSSVAVRSLPAQKKTKANGMPVGDEARMNQLQNLTGNGKVPAYMKLVIELLLETRMEIKTANHKNAELPTAAERLAHDFTCVTQLLDYLDVECKPTAVYRMGKMTTNYPRLIKVVLPASKFQKQAIKRAPRLRFFSPQRGIYLRASLTWEERQRRREERLKRRVPAVSESNRRHPHLASIPVLISQRIAVCRETTEFSWTKV
ncbi:hypothetical protein ANCDUO_00700 [Ancylostoma duodenale]|uniref:Uncharacterized protein n=1 Tax=Ancylostoma duodenale TaxID=51022 RepID=A0A0C2H550_9BILA|nr:hypothetical protein ANCDUO_00700 [Ancylostoma duodenale]